MIVFALVIAVLAYVAARMGQGPSFLVGAAIVAFFVAFVAPATHILGG